VVVSTILVVSLWIYTFMTPFFGQICEHRGFVLNLHIDLGRVCVLYHLTLHKMFNILSTFVAAYSSNVGFNYYESLLIEIKVMNFCIYMLHPVSTIQSLYFVPIK